MEVFNGTLSHKNQIKQFFTKKVSAELNVKLDT